jgi:WD40 repeat protein
MWSVVSPLGDEVPLAEMNVSVRAAPGAGMPPLDYPTNGRPTASIVRWQSEARRLTLRLETRRRAAALPTTRQALIRALNPDLVQPYGPAYLTYTGGTRPLRLPVVYEAGLEHEEASALELRLLALETTWAASAPVEHTLAVQAALDPAGYVLKRSAAGAWTTLGGLGSAPNVLLVAPDGTRYAGGAFAGGVARWDTATAAWVTLAGLEGPVRCLAWGPDGTLYAGGTFSTQGDTVAAYDGSTWTTLGIPGLAPHALAVGAEGTLYGGGVAAGGASVQRWQAGTGWLDMGTGPGGPAYSLLTDARGGLYAGGAFAGGAARWTGAAWEPLGDGLAQSDGSTPEVRALAAGPDGMLYAGGTFDRADGVLASNIARWNGLNWQPLGSGLDGAVLALAARQSDGMLLVGGQFWLAGGQRMPDHLAQWNGYSWFPLGLARATAPDITALAAPADQTVLVGSAASGSATCAAVNVLTNQGSAAAYPVLSIAGPGRLYQVLNWSAGESLFFDLLLLAGEVLTINLQPGYKTVSSTFRGNLLSAVLPGSSLATWRLLPGENAVSLFVDATSASASLHWYERYWSYDGAHA